MLSLRPHSESKPKQPSQEELIASLVQNELQKIKDYFSDKKQEKKSETNREQLISQEKKITLPYIRSWLEIELSRGFLKRSATLYDITSSDRAIPYLDHHIVLDRTQKKLSLYEEKMNDFRNKSEFYASASFVHMYHAVGEQDKSKFIKQISMTAQKTYYCMHGKISFFTIILEYGIASINFFIECDFSLFIQAFGFALGGHKAEADNLSKKLKKNHPDLEELIETEMTLCHELSQKYQDERIKYFERYAKVTHSSLKIYRAVKKKNKVRLIKVLSSAEKNEQVCLPITLLAMKNDKESLDFLIKCNFLLFLAAFFYAKNGNKIEAYELLKHLKNIHPDQASMIHREMIYCFVRYTHLELAYDLLEQFKILYPDQIYTVLQDQAFCAALAGDSIKPYELLKQVEKINSGNSELLLDDIAFGFSFNKNKELPYNLLEVVSTQYPKALKSVFETIFDAKKRNKEPIYEFFMRAAYAIKDPTLRTNLYQELESSIKEINPFLKKAELKRQVVMKKEDISYPQSCAWIQPEIQIFLLNSISLANQKKFYHPILLLQIAEFLIPLSAPVICDLSNKFFMRIGHNRFFKNLVTNKSESLDHEYIPLLKNVSVLNNYKNMETDSIGFFQHSQARNALLINSFRNPLDEVSDKREGAFLV
jgi:hypothetical protein